MPRRSQVAPPTPAAPEPAPEPADSPLQPAPPPAPTVTLRAGTLLPVRLGENLSSEHNQAGDGFTATLDGPLVVDGFCDCGARRSRGGACHRGGKGQPCQRAKRLFALELTKLNTSDGQHVGIQTDAFRKQAVKSTQQDVGIVAAAAGVGAIIGAMAGGGKGAGIGAAAGGAAGTGGVIATRAKAVALSSESKISFRLRQPVTLTEQRNRLTCLLAIGQRVNILDPSVHHFHFAALAPAHHFGRVRIQRIIRELSKCEMIARRVPFGMNFGVSSGK